MMESLKNHIEVGLPSLSQCQTGATRGLIHESVPFMLQRIHRGQRSASASPATSTRLPEHILDSLQLPVLGVVAERIFFKAYGSALPN